MEGERRSVQEQEGDERKGRRQKDHWGEANPLACPTLTSSRRSDSRTSGAHSRVRRSVAGR